MNLYLASQYDERRHTGFCCTLFENETQQQVITWNTPGRMTEDSLAIEMAEEALSHLTHIVPLTIFTQNHTLLKGCAEYIGERRRKMSMGLPVNHARLWQYLDRHIDEWAGYNIALTWQYGTHAMVQRELAKLMVR